MALSTQAKAARLVCQHLSVAEPATLSSYDIVRRRRIVPSLKDLGWGPDLCIQRNKDIYLVHVLSRPELPDWIRRSRIVLRQYPRVRPIVVALPTKEFGALKLAESAVEHCASSGIGLLCATKSGLVTVLPPFRIPYFPCRQSTREIGHVPKWIIERLVGCTSFSPYMTLQLRTFKERYFSLKPRAKVQLYDREADVLEDLLRRIRRGAGGFYMPTDRFLQLKGWERQGAHRGARDHYFHTFNNFLLGLVILGERFSTRMFNQPPDGFITTGPLIGKLKPWEVLWFLTCLNHDPGYAGEKLWPAIYAEYGLRGGTGVTRRIPLDVADELNNGWATELKAARRDLLSLYQNVMNTWLPPQAIDAIPTPFDEALRVAYFDGERSSHSLLSGLTLIQGFTQDRTQATRTPEDHARCLAACEIAALSMLFHDQRCRELLQNSGIPAIPFEQLPYASMLIFVDALQDDRRDIAVDTWPTHAVLNGLTLHDNGRTVIAQVCLRELPVRYWPAKLVEYDSALQWLKSSAEMTFEIQTGVRLSF